MSQLGLARLGPRILLHFSLHIVLLFISISEICGDAPGNTALPRNSTAENLLLSCYNKGFNASGTSFDEYLHGNPSRR